MPSGGSLLQYGPGGPLPSGAAEPLGGERVTRAAGSGATTTAAKASRPGEVSPSPDVHGFAVYPGNPPTLHAVITNPRVSDRRESVSVRSTATGNCAATIATPGSGARMGLVKGRYIRRFSRTERAIHWIHASAFFVLLGSGLVLYLPLLSELVSRRPLVKAVHLYTAVAWAAALFIIVAAGDRKGLRDT